MKKFKQCNKYKSNKAKRKKDIVFYYTREEETNPNVHDEKKLYEHELSTNLEFTFDYSNKNNFNNNECFKEE
jgi:hypothetical protein